MPIDLSLATIIGLVLTVLSVLSQVAFWQRKEYRLDRARSFFTSQEFQFVQHVFFFASGLFIASGWWNVIKFISAEASFFGWLSLISLSLHHGIRIRRQGVLRPQFTTKAYVVIGIATLLLLVKGYFVLNPLLFPALQFSTFLFFLPAAVATGVYGVNIMTNIRKRQTIERAKQARKALPGATVIGITGSVGKTSTKQFTYQILQHTKKNVVATKEHRNSEYMVALDVLEQLTPQVDTYVVEMGAYRTGEIRDIANIVQPRIGVITTIGTQHIDLFGSQPALTRAKWELTRSLPKDGIAVLNADNKQTVSAARKLKKKIVWFSLEKPADVWASDIELRPDGTSLTLHIGDEAKKLTVPLVSRGLVSSLVAAVAAAWAAGIQPKHMYAAVKKVAPPPRTMEIKYVSNGATLIDDSYSASEDAVLNALEYIRVFPQAKKRIVLVPIIELGADGTLVHEKIGRALSPLHADVLIYGKAYQRDIKRGLGLTPAAQVEWITDAKDLKKKVTQDLSSDTVILLEGRVPSVVLKSLT